MASHEQQGGVEEAAIVRRERRDGTHPGAPRGGHRPPPPSSCIGRPHYPVKLRKARHDQVQSQLRAGHAEAFSGTGQNGIHTGRDGKIYPPTIRTNLEPIRAIGGFLT